MSKDKDAPNTAPDQYQRLLDSSPDFLFMTDQQLRITLANSSFLKFTGLPVSEVLGRDCRSFFKENCNIQKYMKYSLDTKDRVSFSERSCLPMLDFTINPILDAEGNPLGFSFLVRDLTESIKKESSVNFRLRMSKLIKNISSKFINLSLELIDEEISGTLQIIGEFVGADDCMLEFFHDERFMLSDSYCWSREGSKFSKQEVCGMKPYTYPWSKAKYTRGEHISFSSLSSLPPEAFREAESCALLGIKSMLSVPLLQEGAIKGYIALMTTTLERAWTDEEILMLKLVSDIFINVEDRRQAELEIHRRQKRLQAYFDLSAVGIAICDISGRWIKINSKFCELLGYTEREILSMKWTDFLTNVNEQEIFPDRAGETRRLEKSYRTKLGDLRHAKLASVSVPKEGGEIDYFITLFEDMTDTIRNIGALRELQDFLKSALSVSDFTIWEWNRVKGRRLFGGKLEGMFGSYGEYFPDENWYLNIHPDDYYVYRSAIEEHAEKRKQFYEAEYRIKDKQGCWINLMVRGISTEIGQDGRPLRIVGVLADVTEKKKIENALRESEVKLRKLFEGATMVAFILIEYSDDEPKITEFSTGAEKMLGYKKNEVLGRDLNILKIPEDFLRKANRRETAKKREFKLYSKTGREIPVIMDSYPLLNSRGKRSHELLVAVDISERKKLELELRARNEALDAINSISNRLHLSLDFHKVIEEAVEAMMHYSLTPSIAVYRQSDNAEFLDLLYSKGFSEERVRSLIRIPVKDTIAGRSFLAQDVLFTNNLPENMEAPQDLRDMFDNGEFISAIFVPLIFQESSLGVIALLYKVKKDFSAFDRENLLAIGRTVGLAVNNANVMTKLKVEIAERNRVQDELKKNKSFLEENMKELGYINARLMETTKELREINASKDKFFSIVAHDLKSPFQGLLGFSNLLLEDIENLSKDEIKSYLFNMLESTRNLYKLIENLLEWSRLQTGQIKFNPESVDINEAALYVLNLLGTNAKKKDITIVSEIRENTVVYADYQMLVSVLQNLVSNALKFTNRGGLVTISSESSGGAVTVSVRDTGQGIPNEDLEKLFRVDSQHSTIGTEKEKGTGLGLILCRELIDRHGGRIWAESRVDEGSVFKFTIPAAVTDNSQ